MSAQIIPIASKEKVDQAWDDYATMAQRLSVDAALLYDRRYQEELSRRHNRWQRLFLIGDQA